MVEDYSENSLEDLNSLVKLKKGFIRPGQWRRHLRGSVVLCTPYRDNDEGATYTTPCW